MDVRIAIIYAEWAGLQGTGGIVLRQEAWCLCNSVAHNGFLTDEGVSRQFQVRILGQA